jgi:hypothetical protein
MKYEVRAALFIPAGSWMKRAGSLATLAFACVLLAFGFVSHARH